MTVRKLEQDGDIATSGTQFISGQSEIAQTVATRLKLFTGEYFRNINDGTPWFTDVLGKGHNEVTRDSVIKRRITQTEGVISLFEFSAELDPIKRTYSITAGVVTSDGNEIIKISEVI